MSSHIFTEKTNRFIHGFIIKFRQDIQEMLVIVQLKNTTQPIPQNIEDHDI